MSETNPAPIAVSLAISLAVYIVPQHCWLPFDNIVDDFVGHLPVFLQLFHIPLQLLLHRQPQHLWKRFHCLSTASGRNQNCHAPRATPFHEFYACTCAGGHACVCPVASNHASRCQVQCVIRGDLQYLTLLLACSRPYLLDVCL